MALLPDTLLAWLEDLWPGQIGGLATEPIPQDGSSRQFWRVELAGQEMVLMFSPHNIPESMAWFNLHKHLASIGIPVPGLLAARPEEGLFLMRDLGRVSLQQAALKTKNKEALLEGIYKPALIMLARLQAKGKEGLDTNWCFDKHSLDADFLRSREMNYFYKQAVQRHCLNEPAGLQQELDTIAEKAAAARPWGLVHRDMQSRNLVLDSNNQLGVVDFQGARLGPAQYDLASLINDPYVDLPLPFRMKMFDFYAEQLAELTVFDRVLFMQGLPWVALSRNLQTLGAFFFLSREKNKPHFEQYILSGLQNLTRLLDEPGLKQLHALKDIAGQLMADTTPHAQSANRL